MTIDNVEVYIERVVDLTVGTGVREQLKKFKEGFNRVFPITDLQSFSVPELGILVSGNENEDWSVESKFVCLFFYYACGDMN